MFFGGAWISGGWGAVGWGCKCYLGSAEIVSFSSRTFSHLNQIWLKCETLLLFFLIIFYYISFDQQSSEDVLKNVANFTGKHQHRCFPVKLAKLSRTYFLKSTSGGGFCTFCTHMTSRAIWVDEITNIMVTIKKIKKAKPFWKNSFLK